MANLKSSKKRIIQNKKRRLINISNKSMIKTFIKKVYISIKNNNKEQALNDFYKMQCLIDKKANKRFIHKNKAARHKSRLMCHINKINN